LKTFSEACEATFMRAVPISEPQDPKKIEAELEGQLDPFQEMLDDIQTSVEADALAYVLIGQGRQAGWTPIEIIKIAFSHGVIVGVEMEKEPLLVGRSTPGEATPPTEAKT